MRVLSLFGAFKRALMALLGRALFSEIEHDERLKTAERLREVESRLQAERNAGNEVTARYLERCLQDAVSESTVRNALDYADSLALDGPRCEGASENGFLRALPDCDEGKPTRRGRKPRTPDQV